MASSNITRQVLARGIETSLISGKHLWIVANLVRVMMMDEDDDEYDDDDDDDGGYGGGNDLSKEVDDEDIEDYEDGGAIFIRFKLQLSKTFIGIARL